MQITDAVARGYNISPFAVLNEDAENVIRVVNFMNEKREHKSPQRAEEITRTGKRRILVNEKTATGGWY